MKQSQFDTICKKTLNSIIITLDRIICSGIPYWAIKNAPITKATLDPLFTEIFTKASQFGGSTILRRQNGI